MFPDNVRKTEYRRKAFPPGVHGEPRWAFPTTWLMENHTGYWQSIAIPKMEEQISKSAWKAARHQPQKALRAAGETALANATDLETVLNKDRTPPYPAGIPLRPDEIRRARCHLPR